MGNNYASVNFEMVLQFPGRDESVTLDVTAEVCQSRWGDLPDEDWCESIDVTWPDGQRVAQDTLDEDGKDVWQAAEMEAMEQAQNEW